MLADWDATILELRAIWAARCGRQRETSHRFSGDMGLIVIESVKPV
ncbi:hypothetical protein BSP239C_04013 [Brevibacterium sp. 239c]|nr:hypothetical protein BSP239C_04013 [Brevibacterium sp. 239c]